MGIQRKRPSGGQETANKRKLAYRQRRRDAGLVEVWAPKDMVPEINRAAARVLMQFDIKAKQTDSAERKTHPL